MFKRSFHNIVIALEAIKANKLKSTLTGLGIMFGVGAVISMLAIGSGAKQQILEQIETIGANNIVIESRMDITGEEDSENGESQNKESRKKFTPGLNSGDYNAIKSIIPTIHRISPEIILNAQVTYHDKRVQGKCIGISNDYLDIYNLKLRNGEFFNMNQIKQGESVCIIGGGLAKNLFGSSEVIGESLKFGSIWLKVIGVLEDQELSNINIEDFGFNNLNQAVFVPQKTLLLRMMDRKKISFTPTQSSGVAFFGGYFSDETGGSSDQKNYHQFDRIIVKVNDSDELSSTASVIERILKRRHNNVKDYEIIVPELLLQQKQEANEMFNFVLGAIAGISLLVGGIGIMNIMFATVMERIREIGIRMAIGAKKLDIMQQFLVEAVFISLIGGILGIMLGVGLSRVIAGFTEIETHVTISSVLIAFIVSVTIGIIFGYSPAQKAAEKDPIESLRHE